MRGLLGALPLRELGAAGGSGRLPVLELLSAGLSAVSPMTSAVTPSCITPVEESARMNDAAPAPGRGGRSHHRVFSEAAGREALAGAGGYSEAQVLSV